VHRSFAALALIALLGSDAAAIAQTQPPALSRSERKERIRHLSDQYRMFLADVEPIMQPEELDAFLRLESDPQRDFYIDDFWHRRDVEQGVAGGSFRTMYYDRLDTARKQYRSATTDRGRIYVIHGPPADLFTVSTESCRLLQPMEIWTYESIPGIGRQIRFIFYVPRNGIDFKLWQPLAGGRAALGDLVSSEAAATSRENLDAAVNSVFGPCDIGSTRTRLECQCSTVADQVLRAIGASEVTRNDWSKAFQPPQINKEAAKRALKSLVVPTPGAAKLTAETTVAYPYRQGERTDVQVTMLVPRSELTVSEAAGTKVYGVDVTGEVLKDDQLFEHYRYRFDFPAGNASDKLPVTVDRLLRPGDYVSRIRVSDANAKREAIVETPITVPALLRSGEEQARRDAGSAAVAKIANEIEAKESTLRIVPLPDELLTGLQHIDTLLTGDEIKAVEFSLDGRKIMTKRTPPYSLDVDLGRVPQLHRIRVVALDAKGEAVTGDEVVVNSGNEPFRVRIVSPRLLPRLHRRTRVEVAVSVPEGKTLEKLELFLNRTRVATLFAPPFVQTLDIPKPDGVAYLRAVATLKDSDLQPVEDVVMVNTPQFMADVNVHLVELPTTVFRDNRPVNDISESDCAVFDDGKPVKIARFEHVSSLPLSAGLAIDTSQSMQPKMAEAQSAASQFFADVLRGGDKAFVVSFDAQPQMVRNWTPNVGDLNAGLARLRADESTALYDAIAFALYDFVGVKGRRALIVVTDGADTASKLTFDQTLEYARRAGVPIYGIGIGIGIAEVDVRYRFSKLCNETGGAAYYVDRASDLKRIYEGIENELRSQYILSFYPPGDAAAKWHEVSVVVRGATAKTIRGYYP